MVGAGIGVGVGGILSKETGAEVGLVVGGNLSKGVEDGACTDAGMGWVLVVAVKVEVGQRSGTVTSEGGVLLRSTGVDWSIGLERAADTEPEVVADVGTVVSLELITGAGEVVTVHTGDTVTGALDCPAAELRKGL